MKKLIFAGLMPLLWLTACNKDKYQTKPQISIKSVSTNVVPVNGSLTIVLSYTDKEGDVGDGNHLDTSLFVRKTRLNKTVVPTTRDFMPFTIPDFPAYPKGEINVYLEYQNILSATNPPNIPGSNPPQLQPDTLNVKLWIKDKAGNISDSVTTETIIVLR